MNYNILIYSLLIASLLAFSSCKTLAQQSKTKFEDNDINNYTVKFPPQEIQKVETQRKKIPDTNSSSRVKFLMDTIFESNKRLKYMEGYRILVYSGVDKDEAVRSKEKLYQLIPTEIDIYSVYKQPTYRVKVGDFTDRLEANRVMMRKIMKEFPKSIIIEDNVFIKRSKD